jgi:NADH dehydrogenase FAD-containing subunit
MPERLSEKARDALERLGVDVRTGGRVEEIDDHGVVVAGERIDASTVIWAAGVAASPAGRWVYSERDRAGRVVVNPELTVGEHENVYAIGDTAACDNGAGAPLPGLAAVAKQQGQFVAKRLRAQIEEKSLPGAFRYRDFGSMATIGREKAVADLRGLQLSGTLAWWLWSVVHVAFMADARNRLSVILDWTWSYLTFSRRIRLITGGPAESGT